MSVRHFRRRVSPNPLAIASTYRKAEGDPNAKQEISLANYAFDQVHYPAAAGGPRFVDRKELQAAIDDYRKSVDILDVRSPADYDNFLGGPGQVV